ncbi:MAG TPA: hypothetical protein VL358_04895 [Caulobacteraceae bacterium]|jgi:hypothetical protein|nr:hypothetical protein [Caulobacteraceae bacterium]
MAEKSKRYQIMVWAAVMALAGVLIGQQTTAWTFGHPNPLGLGLSAVLLVIALARLPLKVWKPNA